LLFGAFQDSAGLASENKDTLDGGVGDDTVYGSAGDDIIKAGVGNNLVFAGPGNDFIVGNVGNDRIYAGDGNDVVLTGDGDDSVWGGTGQDLIAGEGGSDTLIGGWDEAGLQPMNLAESVGYTDTATLLFGPPAADDSGDFIFGGSIDQQPLWDTGVIYNF